MQSLSKYQWYFSQNYNKKAYNLCGNTTNSQSILGKKNGAGGIKLLGFRLYYKATVIKTVWYWHKKHIHRSMKQDTTYRHLICDRRSRNTQWNKHSLFDKRCWENWTTACKRIRKNELKLNYRPNCKATYYKICTGKHRHDTLWHKSQ